MRVPRKSTSESRLDSLFAVMLDELKSSAAYKSSDPCAVRQVLRARKRAQFVNPSLRDKAVEGFLADNRYVNDRKITCSAALLNDARHFITTVLENVTTQFDESEIQNPLSLELLFDMWKFGPGASNGVKGTHAAVKISQEMTCTAHSGPLVFKLRQNNAYFKLYDERKGSLGIVVVQGSRLTTVPKNETTERTIAIEPSGNMALQLAAGKYLQLALRSIGLNIQTQQPINKALAKRGSIDGSVATIDLKSASNLYGLDLIRLLLPPSWVRLLAAVRSEFIEIPDKTQVQLNMVSTMGNGFTFPLMTLINCALIYAYRAQRGGPNLFIDWTSTAVYGDDIIVPTHEYEGVCSMLESVGLVVNHDKSYSEGPFRESCGGDYHDGVDITPFYVESLSCDTEVYVVINKILSWSARNNIWLPMTGLLLRSFLQEGPYFVPEWRNPTEGILTALVPRRYKYLAIQPAHVKLIEQDFACMLAIGGYITSSGPDMLYAPRQFKTKVAVRKSRLPNGYLHGADPLTRSDSATFSIASHVALLYGNDLLVAGLVM